MSNSENLNWQKLHWGRGGITVFMSLVETGILEVVWLPHWWVLIQPDSARFQWDNGSHCCHPSLKNLKALLASLPWWEYQDHCPTFYSSLCDIAKLVDTTTPPPRYQLHLSTSGHTYWATSRTTRSICLLLTLPWAQEEGLIDSDSLLNHFHTGPTAHLYKSWETVDTVSMNIHTPFSTEDPRHLFA